MKKATVSFEGRRYSEGGGVGATGSGGGGGDGEGRGGGVVVGVTSA